MNSSQIYSHMLLVSAILSVVKGLSTQMPFDRFSASCPAGVQSIIQFDPKLLDGRTILNNDEEVWVAVYRSNNNFPSVIREDFFDAMRVATSVVPPATDNDGIESKQKQSISDQGVGVKEVKPVAVGRIKRSNENGIWLMDSLRCSLKKENTDKSCDGGSEHTEALGVCIDELVLQYLERSNKWKNSLRCKATLVSGKLVEARGFVEVSAFSADMATHIAWDVPLSMEMYATRATSTSESGSKVGERSLKILGLLGSFDDKVEHKVDNSENNDDYDPFASIKRYY